jgi:DNA-binding IclR family transcriptional regulator
MKHLKILEVLEGKEMTVNEIAEHVKSSVIETRRLLLRLTEQGKVESFEREGKILWRIKQKSKEEEKFKYA